MTEKTAMQQAFEKAGGNAGPAELHALAVRLLRGHRNPAIALQSFVEAVNRDPALLRALIPPRAVEGEAKQYLVRVAADMIDGPKKATQAVTPRAALPSSPDGGDHISLEDHRASVPAGSSDGGGQTRSVAQTARAAPSREPDADQRAADGAVAKQSARGIFARRIGFDITIGRATLHDCETLMLKGAAMERFGKRLVYELNWSNAPELRETQTVADVASEKQVQALYDSVYEKIAERKIIDVR